MATTKQKGIEVREDFGGYRISEKEWGRIWNRHYPDYVDYWHDYRGEHPEWKEQRRRTAVDSVFTGKTGTTLLIEGLHFVIEEE